MTTISRPPTPRLLGPYSPRCPSPLGFLPPIAPHVAFQQPTYAWPTTPDRAVQPKGPSNMRVPFPPEARRPLAGSTSRRRMSQPLPPPLDLGNKSKQNDGPPPPKTGNALLVVPGQELNSASLKPPLSPTPSEASSVSMYSAESGKSFPIAVIVPEQRQQEEEKPSKNPFCSCFSSLFSSKSSKQKERENRILGPPAQQTVQPLPVPQMVQVTKKRPSPLNL